MLLRKEKVRKIKKGYKYISIPKSLRMRLQRKNSGALGIKTESEYFNALEILINKKSKDRKSKDKKSKPSLRYICFRHLYYISNYFGF